jgi:hypothetical protein
MSFNTRLLISLQCEIMESTTTYISIIENKIYVSHRACLVVMEKCPSEMILMYIFEKLHGPAVSALGVRSRKLSHVYKGQGSDGWPIYYLSLLRASEDMLSSGFRYLQSLTITNQHWPCVAMVRSLCV